MELFRFMEHTKRIVEKNLLLRKDDLIVITGAGGKIAGVKMNRKYYLDAPKGVVGRNSDNTFIKKILKWEPNTTLNKGLAETYAWIKEQYQARKTGKRVGSG
jgi:hypothetical protein